MATLNNVYDIRFELFRFIERQRKVRFVKKLVERTTHYDLIDFLRVYLTMNDPEKIFIKMLQVGSSYKGRPTKEMVRTVSELSRRWAVRLAKLKIEDDLDEIKYCYVG